MTKPNEKLTDQLESENVQSSSNTNDQTGSLIDKVEDAIDDVVSGIPDSGIGAKIKKFLIKYKSVITLSAVSIVAILGVVTSIIEALK